MPATANYNAIYLIEDEQHANAYQDEDGRLFVSLPERVPFEESPEFTPHTCTGHETLVDIAMSYYRDTYENPVDKVWILMNAQPEPVQDPTVPLPVGRIIMVPSFIFLEEVAYGESLADYPEL